MNEEKKSGDSISVIIGDVSGGQVAVGHNVAQSQTYYPPLVETGRAQGSVSETESAHNVQTAKDANRTSAIFISYRRQDSSDVTGRIYDRLIEHFGKPSVFKDVDSIPLGTDFRKNLDDSVAQCDVFLTVIGSQWLVGDVGQRRLDDEADFVRIEIEAALRRNIPIVPVLVQGATIPRSEDLPETLQSLVYRNGIPVRPDPDFHQDMDRLIRGIEESLKRNRSN
jgi:hypothetical protein